MKAQFNKVDDEAALASVMASALASAQAFLRRIQSDEERALLTQYYDDYEHGNKIHRKVYDLLAVEANVQANHWARKVVAALPARRQTILAEKKLSERATNTLSTSLQNR